jgi:DNA repair protein RecO (recombination protein O)
MNRHNEEGIVLRPVDFRERDRILTFLTSEQGKVSGIVHGARSLKSQNRAATEPLVLARFDYVERRQTAMVKIEQCETLDLFPAIRKDYSRFFHASYFVELLLLTEIPPTESSLYFNWLTNILKTLQNEPADLFRKAIWEWNFLCLLGVQPQLDCCQVSGQPLPPDCIPAEKVFYQLDARLGGIRSPSHTEQSPDVAWLSTGTVIGLRQLATGNSQWKPTKLNLRELHKAMLVYLRFHLGREPKSHGLVSVC